VPGIISVSTKNRNTVNNTESNEIQLKPSNMSIGGKISLISELSE